MASISQGKSPAPKRCNASNEILIKFLNINLINCFCLVINENDKKFVRVMLTAPGLRVKRQLNLSMTPRNCKILALEYRKK